jgi:hypothetical protein
MEVNGATGFEQTQVWTLSSVKHSSPLLQFGVINEVGNAASVKVMSVVALQLRSKSVHFVLGR